MSPLKRKIIDVTHASQNFKSNDINKLESIMNLKVERIDNPNMPKKFCYSQNDCGNTGQKENHTNRKRDRKNNENNELRLALKESQNETKRLNELNYKLLNQLKAYEITIQVNFSLFFLLIK